MEIPNHQPTPKNYSGILKARITTPIVVVAIIAGVLVFIAIGYRKTDYHTRKEVVTSINTSARPDNLNVSNPTGTIDESASNDYVNVLIDVDRQPSSFNLFSKQLTPTSTPYFTDLSKYSGLPSTVTKDNIVKASRVVFFSADWSKLFVDYTTYRMHEPDEVGYDREDIGHSYFVCTMGSKSCEPTKMLDRLYAKYPILEGCRLTWDSEQNLFFGSGCGEGGGGGFLIGLNGNTDSIQTTPSSTSPGTYYSTTGYYPTIKKVATILTEQINYSSILDIYDVSDLTRPIKSIKFTLPSHGIINLGALLWSESGDTAYIAGGYHIYQLDINTGNLTTLLYDSEPGIYNAVFSSSRRYIVYVSRPIGDGVKQVMKAVDLRDGNKVIPLLTKDYIYFQYQPWY